MARYNEILVGRFNRHLQKLLSLKGEPPAPQLASEIMPVLPFFVGQEDRYLNGWNKYGASPQVTGAAGIAGGIRFRNPATSNVAAVIELLTMQVSAADTAVIMESGATTADLSGTFSFGANTRWDPRPNAQPALFMSFQGGVAPPVIGNVKLIAGLSAGVTTQIIVTDTQEIILLPGDALQIRTTVVAITLTVNFWWRERGLEESERT